MKENILSILLICLVYNISIASTSSCTNHYTCGNCAVYKDCYWCPSTNKCEDYYGEKFANLICPSKWIQHDSLCPENAARNNNGGADSAIFNLLNGNMNQAPLQSLLAGKSTSTSQSGGAGGASSQELKDLLHKLLLLKLLRKIKAEGTSSLTAEESKMLSQLSSYRQQQQQIVAITTTTTTTTKMPDMTNEIKQLLDLLGKSKQKPVVTTKTTIKPGVVSPIEKITAVNTTTTANTNNNNNNTPPPQSVVNTPKPQLMSNETVMSLLKKIDEQNAGVEYQENQPVESLGNPHENSKVTVKPTSTIKNLSILTPSPTTSSSSSSSNNHGGTSYCKLYDEVDLCNADHNCTWCNTKDICIGRSDTDYKGCVAAKDNLKDKEFGKRSKTFFLTFYLHKQFDVCI